MKRFLLILLSLVLLATGGLFVYKQISPAMGRDPITSGESFFALLRDDLAYDAYRSTAASVQRLSFEAFERAVFRHQLEQVQEIRWTRTALGETEANLTGDFFKDGAEPFTLSLRLVREASRWKVVSVVSPATGAVFVESSERSMPSETSTDAGTERVVAAELPSVTELEGLARETLLKFNEAVQIEYFAPFYQQISTAWQQQTSPEALLNAFQVFIDNRISFPGIARMQPEFTTPPSINADGILILDGIFPHSPYQILFELKYVFEEGRWRAFGINLNLVAQEATSEVDPPAPATESTSEESAVTPETTPAEIPSPTPALQIPAFRESPISDDLNNSN